MSEWRKRVRVGVIGGNRPEKRHLDMARKVGECVARAGAILVCGGLAGVMEAAASAAKKAGGMTVGIIPGSVPGEANPHIDVPIATGMGYARNCLVAMNSDVLIAIDGEYGTLTEIAYGNIYGKKVIGLDTWDIKGVVTASSPEEAVALALQKE